ncbi:hypothetical protein LPJ64_001139 [Coemansia asiatica]|uniref:DUF4246 domain-containing protein n=1 Tax=Coemansia asiatica TaxID=1052880 RepID=A0A9W7XP33_9FUNG|nr:hypothetical protein LPJ64_001139 [Coemansia asiatica]
MSDHLQPSSDLQPAKEGPSLKTIDQRLRELYPLDAIYIAYAETFNTLSEKRIRSASGAIRMKTNWMTKMNDQTIRDRWTAEAVAQGLTEKEISYMFDELAYYATLHVPGSKVFLSSVDRVWYSDELIDEMTAGRLLEHAAVLEALPEKDWHPRSNDQVLNLIHPSLFPLNYSVTPFVETPIASPAAALELKSFGKFPGSITTWKSAVEAAFGNQSAAGSTGFYISSIKEGIISQKFCWLPTEFDVAMDGAVEIKSYINNLHPVKYASFYPTIAAIFGKFVPMLEQVITDMVHRREQRVVPDPYNWFDQSGEPEYDENNEEEYYDRYDEWEENKPFIEPQPEPFKTPDRPTEPYSLLGRRLQAIVKMSNIMLTPDNPVYEGGAWHVEALANERIIATGIYYYDVENITENELDFRERVDEEIDYEQSDERGLDLAYGMFTRMREEGEDNDYEIPISQEIGGIRSKKGRCLVFPNIYQHRVSGFELADKTKSGHRKILAFFFIDPSTRIPSTEIVPPQQQEWWAERAMETDPLAELPLIIKRGILENVKYPVSLNDAKKLRLELMDERSSENPLINEVFRPNFNFCEH